MAGCHVFQMAAMRGSSGVARRRSGSRQAGTEGFLHYPGVSDYQCPWNDGTDSHMAIDPCD